MQIFPQLPVLEASGNGCGDLGLRIFDLRVAIVPSELKPENTGAGGSRD